MTRAEMTMYNLKILEERTKVEEAAFALFRLGKYEESNQLLDSLDDHAFITEEEYLKADDMPQMLTIAQAAEKTGLSYDRIRKMCLENKLIYVKSGSKYLINSNHLAEYLSHGDGNAVL